MPRPLICEQLTNTNYATREAAEAVADANNHDDAEWEYVAEPHGAGWIVSVYDGDNLLGAL